LLGTLPSLLLPLSVAFSTFLAKLSRTLTNWYLPLPNPHPMQV
jgi:hypothetical protein